MKKLFVFIIVFTLALSMLAGCAAKEEVEVPVGTWDSYEVAEIKASGFDEEPEISVSLTVNEDASGELTVTQNGWKDCIAVTVEGSELVPDADEMEALGITLLECDFNSADMLLVLHINEKKENGEAVACTALCMKHSADEPAVTATSEESTPLNEVTLVLGGSEVNISVEDVRLQTDTLGILEVELGGINSNTPGWRELKVYAVDNYGTSFILPVTTASSDGFVVASDDYCYGLPEKIIIGTGEDAETTGYVYYVEAGIFADNYCYEIDNHVMHIESTKDDGSITNGTTEPEGKYVNVGIRCINGTLTMDELMSYYQDMVLIDKNGDEHYAVSTGFELTVTGEPIDFSDLDDADYSAMMPVFDIPEDISIKDCTLYVADFEFSLADVPMNVSSVEYDDGDDVPSENFYWQIKIKQYKGGIIYG